MVSPNYFDGKIDEVRIWNQAIPDAQVYENMCASLTGNETGLVSYYRFDQINGTTAYDATANKLDGILTNMEDVDWVPSAAFNIWVGGESSGWMTPSNWSRGAIPSGESVSIYNWPLLIQYALI